MKKLYLFLLLNPFFNFSLRAQENVSIGTGISVLRNFSPQQKFWAVGHTLQVAVHFSERQSAYAWMEYYTDGTFRNNFTAVAKSSSVNPQQQRLVATGHLGYRHFSAGWKHYFRGGYQNQQALNIYGLGGFGFLFASVSNGLSPAVDTTLYAVGTVSGEGTVRKLTFDLGIGGEQSLNQNMYVFADARTWLPASSNESRYLHSQQNLPLPFMLTAGIRVVIGP